MSNAVAPIDAAPSAKPPRQSYVNIYRCEFVRSGCVAYRYEKVTCTAAACRVVSQIVKEELAKSPNEKFVVLALDTKHKFIGMHVVTEGTLDASLVHPREVFRVPIILNAASVLLVHNHPSGDVTPSREDFAVTERLKKAGEIVGIQVLDHIVCGWDDQTSE